MTSSTAQLRAGLIRRLCIAVLILCCSSHSYALSSPELLRIAGDVRSHGCGRHAGVKTSLTLQPRLTSAAHQIDRASRLRDTLQRVGYRADQSAIFHLSGRVDAAVFRRSLQEQYCELITDRTLSEIGMYVDEKEIWVILAAPFAPPSSRDTDRVVSRVLQLVNIARAKSRRCGSKNFAPAEPLTMNETLTRAAATHAKDMAAHDSVEHEGSDGSSPADRATRAGYRWKSIGENIAGGQLTPEEVVGGWLDSPGHCANIMDKDFRQMGLAYIVNPAKHLGIYWAQEFGLPR